MRDDPTTLVSPAWLAAHPEAIPVDASWHLDGRDAEAGFRAGHIPAARRMDLDAVADLDSGLPHTVPPPHVFAAWAGGQGIAPHAQVVVYDTEGLFSAARAWWTFRRMGHARVAVLDGGLPAWIAAGHPVEAGEPRPVAPIPYTTGAPLVGLTDADGVARALATGRPVLDARGPARFRGEAPEPRPGLRPGHMPGATNLHYASLLDGGRLKPDADLAALLPEGEPVLTCGSGVTAAILALALARLGRGGDLYDGSWAEWGAANQTGPSRPAVTGP